MEALPFRTQVMDVVHSSHCLEHLDNPSKGLAELKRVGKRGIVVVPSRWRELVFVIYHPTHHWTISSHGEALDITKSYIKGLRKLLGRVFLMNFRIQLRSKFNSVTKDRLRENFVKW